MDDIVLVSGSWSFNQNQWLFLVDKTYGCRIVRIDEDLIYDEFMGMVYEDFGLNKQSDEVKLSYMSNLVMQSLPQDTPPVFVSNERQLHVFVQQFRKEAIRLCVEISTRSREEGKWENYDAAFNRVDPLSGRVDSLSDRVDILSSRVDPEFNKVEFQFSRARPMYGGITDNVKHEFEHDDDDDVEFRFDYCDDMDGASSDDEDYINFRRKSKEEEKKNILGKTKELGFNAEYLELELSTLEVAVGQRYSSKNELDTRLKILSILQRFDFDVVASSRTVLDVKCWIPNCQWRVRASCIDESACFFVRKYSGKHNCSVTERSGRARQASAEVLGRLYMEFVGGIGPSVLPNHVADSLNKRFGLKV